MEPKTLSALNTIILSGKSTRDHTQSQTHTLIVNVQGTHLPPKSLQVIPKRLLFCLKTLKYNIIHYSLWLKPKNLQRQSPIYPPSQEKMIKNHQHQSPLIQFQQNQKTLPLKKRQNKRKLGSNALIVGTKQPSPP